MTHAASLKVLTQRWVMSHLTRAQCCPVWVIAERERGRDTQILRTSPQLWGQDRGPDHHHDTETRDQPLPWHPGPSGWRPGPGPACVMLWSYRLLKYFTFQMRLSSQIAALASQSYSGGAALVFSVQCQKDIFTEGLSHNNSSNHLFSVPRPRSWRRVMCCDGAWRDKMHLSRLSPGLVSSLGR